MSCSDGVLLFTNSMGVRCLHKTFRRFFHIGACVCCELILQDAVWLLLRIKRKFTEKSSKMRKVQLW